MNTLSSIPLALQTDRDLFKPVCSPAEDRSLLDRIKALLRGFPTCTEGRSHSVRNILNSSLANLSSVTTANGPWVYTIVPWED
jgi:hypothetical protein